MPVYEVHCPEGLLSDEQRQQVASEITEIHTAATGAPELFVNVVYTELPEGRTFTAGAPSRMSFIVGSIRVGRDIEVRQGILRSLSEMWTRIAGVHEEEVLLVIQEGDPRAAMEAGLILPGAGQEAEWFAEHRDKLVELGLVPAS